MSIEETGYQKPITIKTLLKNIVSHNYILPAIQREFVWGKERIIKLFDSILCDYPIGTFLFWQVIKKQIDEFQYYEIMSNYHQRDLKRNPKINITSKDKDKITAILDGQQRITALNIGLKGYHATKLPWKHKKSDDAYPKKFLYLNPLSKSEKVDLVYDFKFLTPEEAKEKNEKQNWFKLEKILSFNTIDDVLDYIDDLNIKNSKVQKFARSILMNLYRAIYEKPILQYYLLDEQDIETVLNIFIRVNSGGIQLSYSDLLLSIATAQWEGINARDEITKFVDELNRLDFNFNKDFILKSSIILSDIKNIAFKVANFTKANMKTIKDNWTDIKKAILTSVSLMRNFGFNEKTLPSNNALIPIAYYILKKGNPANFDTNKGFENDRKLIKNWLLHSLLKRVFSASSDTFLRNLREVICHNLQEFPFGPIVDSFKGDASKNLSFSRDNIDYICENKYGEKYTFSSLSVLYPLFDFNKKFTIDHIFPKSLFKKKQLGQEGFSNQKIDFYLENVNSLPNLQLLPGTINQQKLATHFSEWIETNYPDSNQRNLYMNEHHIPKNIGLEFDNFDEFFNKRKELIMSKYQKLLKIG